ncbi:YaiI/YqxD family protein [Uliginosibacterium sp. 31-16]|uniref:YaiI/YqxD family protein n=1 Tax=Uliginosibacterium sp. 31-16 TaxID=3068315 RepID=UPI00273FF257|nr:YaiI/YqxD family protein [Uliginosibacterium sp. 31-16]MDP5239807.1 YaiI/YqxD family protein [Uliginosibacterium sp. 31-16]
MTDAAQPTAKPRLWVDADACPVVIKEIIFRAATRKQMATVLVANQMLRVPPSPFIRAVQVPSGFDVADNYIAAQVQKGDLVVTADIPLAAQVIERGASAINPRGELYTAANIRESLSMRDFMESLRSSGVQTGGPAAFSQADRQAFANQLDRLLARLPG